MILKNFIQISQKKEKKFLFNNGSILEINDYHNNRSRGNVSFIELSEIINTLSNQDFAGMDKFILRTSLEKIKEMRVKMNKTKKRNGSCLNDFLSSPFSPVMTDLAARTSAWESSSLYTDIVQKKFFRK